VVIDEVVADRGDHIDDGIADAHDIDTRLAHVTLTLLRSARRPAGLRPFSLPRAFRQRHALGQVPNTPRTRRGAGPLEPAPGLSPEDSSGDQVKQPVLSQWRHSTARWR
jgi:hypothetical protein